MEEKNKANSELITQEDILNALEAQEQLKIIKSALLNASLEEIKKAGLNITDDDFYNDEKKNKWIRNLKLKEAIKILDIANYDNKNLLNNLYFVNTELSRSLNDLILLDENIPYNYIEINKNEYIFEINKNNKIVLNILNTGNDALLRYKKINLKKGTLLQLEKPYLLTANPKILDFIFMRLYYERYPEELIINLSDFVDNGIWPEWNFARRELIKILPLFIKLSITEAEGIGEDNYKNFSSKGSVIFYDASYKRGILKLSFNKNFKNKINYRAFAPNYIFKLEKLPYKLLRYIIQYLRNDAGKNQLKNGDCKILNIETAIINIGLLNNYKKNPKQYIYNPLIKAINEINKKSKENGGEILITHNIPETKKITLEYIKQGKMTIKLKGELLKKINEVWEYNETTITEKEKNKKNFKK